MLTPFHLASPVDDLEAARHRFEIEPCVRSGGGVGEQATKFFYDPAGKALECKALADKSQVFAK